MTDYQQGVMTGQWTLRELIHYMDRHTDAEGEWDGAAYPRAIRTPAGDYLCQVCQQTYADAEEPHDCVDNLDRDSPELDRLVAEWVAAPGRCTGEKAGPDANICNRRA